MINIQSSIARFFFASLFIFVTVVVSHLYRENWETYFGKSELFVLDKVPDFKYIDFDNFKESD